ncbi:uncharacterized protein LOC132699297 [Cylas formicarius]|uniref:uncharacterized protein LOC132699297 n=1 Tax=Cylas formicarius TaxID=197179 RepID=UPI002958643C|nr:uncharacterized protein LOC132699297 [Cylas formicarius]XP_060521916.1 uncharacterized protein LOC132699297 [Cylas formicarius]
MDVETPSYSGKINQVLERFLDPGFKINSDVYLNLLLTHLTGTPDGKDSSVTIPSHKIFHAWITKAVTLWKEKKVKPQPSILSFALNLAGSLSKDEQIFVKFNTTNTYENLISVVRLDGEAIVKLGFINLLYSLLEHKSGVQWVVATSYWMDILSLILKPQTLYIRKQGYQFFIKLLEKTISFNRHFGLCIVGSMLNPIKEFIKNLPKSSQDLEIQSQPTYDTLHPALAFVTEVLEVLFRNLNMDVLKLFVEQEIKELINSVLLLSQNEEFSFELLKIKLLLMFYQLHVDLRGLKVIQETKASQEVMGIFNLLSSEIVKDHPRTVIKLCHQGVYYWKQIDKNMPVCFRQGELIEFENQMVIFQLLPIMVFSFNTIGEQYSANSLNDDDFKREYMIKLLKKSAAQTVQLAYSFKNRLLALPNVIDHAVYALQFLLRSKQFYSRETGALVFQPLIYCLQDCLQYCSKNRQLSSPKSKLLLDSLLEAIVVYIETFSLTWKDSIETICVMNLAYEFLNISELLLEPRLVVQGLKLLNTAISKYMSPNMVLLIDTPRDSILGHIGPVLYAKCHNPNWEIRDSALEVIYTLCSNAHTRYPSFQKILLDAGLPQLILEMALKDGESFVRATALRCLQESILVPTIWGVFNELGDFYEKILGIFRDETEGVVRKEAALLVCKIYEEHAVADHAHPKIYDVMTHAATADLHWEVKVNALSFWEKVVNRHLHHQGMIDGTFPSVTFSKENRKIVTLNAAEVRRRLVKTLDVLSANGCLAVFVAAIQDDCDLEVSRTATRIAGKFVTLLKQYEVSVENVNSNGLTNVTSPNCWSGASAPMTSSDGTPTDVSPDMELEVTPHSTLSSFFEPVSPECAPPISPSLNLDPHPSVSSDSNSPGVGSTPEFSDETSLYANGFAVPSNPAALDDIVNANDINLLQSIYDPSDQRAGIGGTVSMRTRRVLSPGEFIEFAYKDVDTHVEDRAQWLSSLDEFGSLLDDILRDYNDGADVNDMDCY